MKYLLFDCNNLCHRSWHRMRTQSPLFERNGAIYGLLRDIRFLQEIHECENIVFCFDSNAPLHRLEIYPEYKTNHNHKRDGKEILYRQIDALCQTILPEIGFKNIYRQNGYEADDLIAEICASSDDEFIIISSDSDLHQLLFAKEVSVWNPMTNKIITEKDFKLKWKINPWLWTTVKSLVGDPGDNIKGVYGVGEATAIKYLKKETIRPTLLGRINKFIEDGSAELNRKLMDLPWPGLELADLQKDAVKRDQWDKRVVEYEVPSLVGKYPASAI